MSIKKNIGVGMYSGYGLKANLEKLYNKLYNNYLCNKLNLQTYTIFEKNEPDGKNKTYVLAALFNINTRANEFVEDQTRYILKVCEKNNLDINKIHFI